MKEDDSVDIGKLISEFWVARKTILRVTVLFTFLGFFVAIFSKKEFTASTTFVPVNQGESVKGSLGGLASLAGINLGGSNNDAEISPQLYPQIINSIPFQLELLNTPLTIDGQKQPVTYREFYKDIYNPGLLAYIKKYTLGLPSVIISLLKPLGDNVIVKYDKATEIIDISLEDNGLIEQLVGQIDLQVNSKEGFVTIEVVLPEAIASAQLTLKAQKLLQEYALKFKTQKSIEQLKYVQARFLEKQSEFNSVKIELARFQDQNNAINTALGRTKLLQLQSDYDLVFSVYSELAKQLETQKLQVKQDTPLFTVLKPVSIPTEKSGPKRFLILVGYLFLGFILSVGYVGVKRYFGSLKKDWALKNKEV